MLEILTPFSARFRSATPATRASQTVLDRMVSSVFVPAVASDCVIDISHWQMRVDFAAVKRDGVHVVFIKATQGADYQDPLFSNSADTADAAGLLWAPYHFITGDAPEAQFANLNEHAAIEPGMVVMLDWETKDANADLVAELGQMVENVTGRAPLMYCGRYQLAKPHPVLSKWPLMLPEYGTHPICPPGWDEWLFHQYTDHGAVHGIHGHVDRSVFAGTVEDLKKWWECCGTCPEHAAVPVPVVVDAKKEKITPPPMTAMPMDEKEHA